MTMARVTDEVMAAAHSRIYAFLACAFADPDGTTLARLRQAAPVAAEALAIIGGTESRAALAAYCDAIEPLGDDDLAGSHHLVFGHGISGDCPPYEGEYGQPHIFQKTQALADNAGFFEAFGLAPATGFADRLDHIAVELEFLHVLAVKEAYALGRGHGAEQIAIVRDATRKYLNEHLGRWAPAFAARMEAKAHDSPYGALARLLAAFVADEKRAWDIAPVPTDLLPVAPQDDDGPTDCDGCATAAAGFATALRGEP